jgi:hypothetical protein
LMHLYMAIKLCFCNFLILCIYIYYIYFLFIFIIYIFCSYSSFIFCSYSSLIWICLFIIFMWYYYFVILCVLFIVVFYYLLFYYFLCLGWCLHCCLVSTYLLGLIIWLTGSIKFNFINFMIQVYWCVVTGFHHLIDREYKILFY